MLGNPTGQAEVDISREGAQRRQATEGIWYANTYMCDIQHFNTVHIQISMYVVMGLSMDFFV